MKFSQKHPVEPPICKFSPPILHPNVCASGVVHHPIIGKNWSSNVTVKQILLEIQKMMVEPVPYQYINDHLDCHIDCVRSIEIRYSESMEQNYNDLQTKYGAAVVNLENALDDNNHLQEQIAKQKNALNELYKRLEEVTLARVLAENKVKLMGEKSMFSTQNRTQQMPDIRKRLKDMASKIAAARTDTNDGKQILISNFVFFLLISSNPV